MTLLKIIKVNILKIFIEKIEQYVKIDYMNSAHSQVVTIILGRME
jgi:hypothetical protein